MVPKKAKPPKVSVGSLRLRHKKWDDADAPAVDTIVRLLQEYVHMAASEDPALREAGLARLRQVAILLLDADPAVRSLRAMADPDKRAQRVRQLVQFAKEVGYPAKCTHKVFVMDAKGRFNVSARTIGNWLEEAKEKNLLQ